MQPTQIQAANYFAFPCLPRRPKNVVTKDRIINAVSKVLGISYDRMNTRVRNREVVQARQIAWHLMKSHVKPKMSLLELGSIFGGFDHTTVINSLKNCANYMETDEDYLDLVNRCEIELNNPTKVLIASYDSQVKAVIVE